MLDRPQKVNFEKLKGDASDRKYYRVQCQNKSYVLMQLSEVEKADLDKGNWRWVEVHRILKQNHIRVPEIYEINKLHGIFLIEDATNDHLEQFSEHENLYTEALKIIGKIQKLALKPSFFENYQLNSAKCMQEMQFFRTHFLGNCIPKGSSFDIAAFFPLFEKLSQFFEMTLTVPCHRDFHCRNLMYKNGELILIDFQDLMLGNPVYDLTSLVFDNYLKISLDRKMILLEEGINIIADAGGFQKKSLSELMLPTVLQRTLKALGSYGYFKFSKNMPQFIELYEPIALKNLQDAHAIFSSYWDPKYDVVLKMLECFKAENSIESN